ncbi:Arc family DNA-binding protein [Metapseudomonas lalkuanensis]|uniref:Arc family DNA-binding protein n=1 Tax=Metapseudomonas lalkuanensis TaxID=2604832 RepID=A0A5J6QJG2_9GAMM|nr:Arc family DNA-binding protein [Pseudomonas lalkuanensis]QEY62543.1 Arc family DNA-binding protein [Pseudomonas lalkuanensis]
MDVQKKAIGVRMPEDLKEWLSEQAEKNSRSVSGEIVHRLRQSREQERESKI